MDLNEFLLSAAEIKDEITQNRKYLHANAETGFALKNTLAYVKAQLEKMGYTPVMCGKAGLVAVLCGKKPGKVFLLRADMDALPIEEQSGEEFSSNNGSMHACGHDMHTAMLLGAAKLLKKYEDEIHGTVKLMFQPAEEIFEGCADMIGAGVLKEPDVDCALMIHVMAGMPFKTGTVIVSNPGVSAPAADYFEIVVKGKGCHGSMPNMGVDPIIAAAHIVTSLEEINARELSLKDRAVLTVGTFHAGTAKNAIPDEAVLGGSLRTFDEDVRTFVKQRITDVAESVAAAFRASAEVSFGSGCPTLKNDEKLSLDIYRYVKELLGEDMAFTVEQLSKGSKGGDISGSAGSEDFAYVSHKVPSIMLALAAGQKENGYVYSQHHPKVKFDNDALDKGSAVYAYTAIRWLKDH